MQKVLIIIFLVAILNSCDLSLSNEKEIKDTILKYNHALMEAYEREEFDVLKDVTTEREFKKVVVYIQSYAAAGEKIRAIPKEIKIKKIKKIDKIKVEAITNEKWRYERLELDTGRNLVPETLYEYEMRYEIIKENDKWKVATLKILKEEKTPLK